MDELININMGEMAVSHNDTHIKTGSVGSCVVIVLYDDEAKVGGMAHAMLPSRKEKENKMSVSIDTAETMAKYADESVDRLAKEIEKIGGRKERLRAKLIGGSRMFKILSGDKYGIGYQNIESARQRLVELEIPIENEDTGGTVGRIVEFNLSNGLVDVSTKM